MLEEGDGDMERLNLGSGWRFGENTELIPGFRHECVCGGGETVGPNTGHDLVLQPGSATYLQQDLRWLLKPSLLLSPHP